MGLVCCIKLAASHRQINGKYVSNRPKLVHQRGRMLEQRECQKYFRRWSATEQWSGWASAAASHWERESSVDELCEMLRQMMPNARGVYGCLINDASLMIGILIPQNVIITALFYDCDCILPDRQINYVQKETEGEREPSDGGCWWD